VQAISQTITFVQQVLLWLCPQTDTESGRSIQYRLMSASRTKYRFTAIARMTAFHNLIPIHKLKELAQLHNRHEPK